MNMRRQRRHRREKQTFEYECSLTGERYKLTARAPQPKELLSVAAYYEMNPDKDDRPAVVKKKLGLEIPEN
ncbi:MAG: hypothetical protein WDA09_09520 [Bacteriovoracaceae bacterium]